jgi:hypothetical protein
VSELRCPVCRADNKQGPACRRCRADLSMLDAIEEERSRLLEAARQSLTDGNGSEAIAAAKKADDLRHGSDSQRILALGLLLRRNFAEALQAYSRVRKP